MRIGVLSKSEKYWSTQGILKAIADAGHEPLHVRTDKVRLVVGETLDATYLGDSLAELDVIIPRIGRSLTELGYLLLKHLATMG
ncbi:MAG: hypothetical protein R3291_05205, partial [Thermoplasmata archaeon]|nr:hypothetical protein [Thermoplasmata archaeon]